MRTSRSAAFSLVELLIVITIIVIMASLMGPTLNSALRGTALTQSSDKVIGVLSLAHQTAVSKAQTVDDYGIYSPMMKAQILPNSVIISTSTNLSTLLSNGTNSTPTNSIPRAGSNYTYASFQYYRSGSTSLAATSLAKNIWGVTVVNASDMNGANSNNLPLNYTTIVIDPYNGSLKTYRPHL